MRREHKEFFTTNIHEQKIESMCASRAVATFGVVLVSVVCGRNFSFFLVYFVSLCEHLHYFDIVFL
jgi:hypothetical protein